MPGAINRVIPNISRTTDSMSSTTNEISYRGKDSPAPDQVDSDTRGYRATSVDCSPRPSFATTDEKAGMVPVEMLAEMGGQQNKQADAFGSVQGHTAFSNPDPQAPLGADGQPDNFGVIVPGMYRSSFPQAEDYAFLEKLKLKTIVTLVQKDFSDHFFDFVTRNGINHHVVDMKGTKKEEIPAHQMSSILEFVLDKKHHPLLIHCKQGRHRTGCVVGAVRKATGWNLGHILDEYKNYAHPKPRDCDIAYLTGFQPGVFPQWGRGDAADFPGFVANRGSRYRDLLDLIDVSKFHELSGRRRVTLIMTLIILMVIIMAIFDPYPPCFNKRCN